MRIDALRAGGRLGRVAVAPAPVIARRPALGPCLLAHFGEFLRRGEAGVGLAFGNQLFGDLAMAVGAGKLRYRLAVPVDTEP